MSLPEGPIPHRPTTLGGGGGTAEDSRKDRTLVHTVDVPIARPQDTSAGDSKEPDVDILIDSDGS